MKRIACYASIAAAALGCSKTPLTPLSNQYGANPGYVNVEARFCTLPPTPAKQKLKYLFIVDHSASNQPVIPNALTPNDVSGTDPQGSRRYGPMIQFIRNLAPDPYSATYFDLIDFNDTARQAAGFAGFDPDAADFITKATTDWVGSGTPVSPSPADQGFTNYQAALKLALQLIHDDAQVEAGTTAKPPVASTYQIIFVSDGVPTVAATGGASPVYTQDFTNDLLPVISQILSLKTDPGLGPSISGISLNTAYYFTTTQVVAAETLLHQMADAGNGVYLTFGAGQNVLYQQFAPPSRVIRHLLSDAFVINQNAVWWDDGRFLQDSDGDGLPDVIEAALGSNPFAADSDGNGVSDLVEYRTKGKPCQDAACKATNRDRYSICDGFSPSPDPGGNVTFAATSNDGLNDCEKFVLGANRDTFSSNGDFIPDLLALKTSLPFIAGTNATFADPFQDGLTAYNKLKQGLPTSVSMRRLLGFQTRKSTLNHEDSVTPDTDCYHLEVDHVAIAALDNTLQVSVIENTAAIDDKPILRTAVRKLSGAAATVTFTSEEFK